MNICWHVSCSVMRLSFIPVASSFATTAGYVPMNNHTSPWKVNVWLGLTHQRTYGPLVFAETKSRQHRIWACLSHSYSPNCLPKTFWVWWHFNRTAPHRTLRTLCVITSSRCSQDAGLEKAHHGSGQHARLI